jgi:hypothetical protein
MTNYIRRNQGAHRWDGYTCFKLYHDHEGNLFPGGAKYVVFSDGWLVGCFPDQSEADKAFLLMGGARSFIRLSEYKVIDGRLR